MPALGTHAPMADWQIERMFPGLPRGLIREHDWRNGVVTIGEVPADFVCRATEGLWTRPWPAQLNRLIWEGGHDLVLSIGQVVPHEVMGMANYNKNVFVGCGGAQGINESHFIGAAYGMERMMGRADTPLRRILNYAQDHFCAKLPLVYVLTVIGPRDDGSLAVRGLYIGSDVECFHAASELSVKVNFTVLDEAPRKMVVYLDPEEFHSTWLGNKAVYRTRMAIADGGELIVLAPGVKTFGEDRQIDALIRKYGYTRHAAGDAVGPRDRGPAAESLRGRPPDPRLLRGTLPHHLLPRASFPRGNRIGRLWLRRFGRDARALRAALARATAGPRCPTASGSSSSATRPWGCGRSGTGWSETAGNEMGGGMPSRGRQELGTTGKAQPAAGRHVLDRAKYCKEFYDCVCPSRRGV